jgi:hypothetical protein
MAVVRVFHGIDDLRSDLAGIPVELAKRAPKVVKKNATQGNRIAKGFAKTSAGAHGKHYSNRFSVDMLSPFSAEYGPKGRPQGEMSFEHGSRNQPPHLDLNKSADIQGPKFADDISDMVDGLFW